MLARAMIAPCAQAQWRLLCRPHGVLTSYSRGTQQAVTRACARDDRTVRAGAVAFAVSAGGAQQPQPAGDTISTSRRGRGVLMGYSAVLTGYSAGR